MKFAKKFLALCLTACLLCGLPLSLSVGAADTITLDKAVLLSTTDTTVTVQATFSAPIWLRPRRATVISLRNAYNGGGCGAAAANHWTWNVSESGGVYGVEYVNPITSGSNTYSSVINLTFPRCACSDHANLWGADGKTLPNPIELCINDLWGASGDGVLDINNARGINGELLAANYTADGDNGKDFSYVTVEYKPITLESATLLSTTATTATVRAIFSAPVRLNPDHVHRYMKLKDAYDSGGCAVTPWVMSGVNDSLEYVNATTVGNTTYSDTINLTFNKCGHERHTKLWGADGNTLPSSIVLCIDDLWGTAGDGLINKSLIWGIHQEQVAGTNGTEYAYVAVTDNRTLQEKLNTGDGVTLTKNETVDGLIIPADKTLDLNGYTLTANQVISRGGSVVDLKDGVGGIAIVKNGTDDAHLLQLPANNTALPLYEEGFGYRFFVCSLVHSGREKGTDYQFGYILQMSDAAFAMLKDANGDGELDADMDLDYDITIQVDDKEAVLLQRKFKDAILMEYAQKQLLDDGNTYAAILRVTGFERVTTQTVTVTSLNPQVISGTGVVISASNDVVYTYPNAQ